MRRSRSGLDRGGPHSVCFGVRTGASERRILPVHTTYSRAPFRPDASRRRASGLLWVGASAPHAALCGRSDPTVKRTLSAGGKCAESELPQNRDTPCARVHLVHDHVLEALVVHRAEEDVGRQRLAGHARGDVVLARVVVAVLHKELSHVVGAVAAKRLHKKKKKKKETHRRGPHRSEGASCSKAPLQKAPKGAHVLL